LTRYPKDCTGVKFIDVDYEDLMLKKRDLVHRTTELNEMLSNVSSGASPIILQSDEYAQVACDLRDLSKLSSALSSIVDLEDSLIMFSAEVSVTYMSVTAADALIKWTGTLPNC
jgi:tRNA wybutosine-synthesizing protein 4